MSVIPLTAMSGRVIKRLASYAQSACARAAVSPCACPNQGSLDRRGAIATRPWFPGIRAGATYSYGEHASRRAGQRMHAALIRSPSPKGRQCESRSSGATRHEHDQSRSFASSTTDRATDAETARSRILKRTCAKASVAKHATGWGLPVTGMLAACALQRPPAPPPGYPILNGAAQVHRYEAMQEALDHNASGDPRLWIGPGRAKGRITPLETVSSKLYGWCRSYEEEIADAVQQQSVIGIACRTREGWLVLDLRRRAVTSYR